MTFNDDVNEDLINLHHHRTEFEIIPELVKDYKLQAWIGEAWSTIAEGQNNHIRHHVHTLSSSVSTNRLRILVESTNGSAHAEIVELRCYR
ncbi:hypothetical protein D3C84_968260 [compost metagenome]